MPNSIPIFRADCDRVLYNPDELIDLFLNCTADGICIVDMENRFIRINHVYTKIFGYTDDDLIGRSFKEFPNPDFVNDIISQVKKGKAFPNMITQRQHKDGRTLDIAVSYSPFRDSNGEIIAIIAIYRDITKEISIERELNRTRELYKLITENTSDMIKLYSKDNTILYASPSHEKVIGYTPEELIGKSAYDIMMPEEKAHTDMRYQKILETKDPQLFQIKVRSKSGKVIYTEVNVTPIFNEKNEIDSYVTVSRNITDRIENDVALRNLDRLSIIGQLAAGVGHEIRNPLTALKGFSKLLKSAVNGEKQDEYLYIIMEELDRIDMIVNEFMSLAKPQAIQCEQANLRSILESTVNVLRPQALLDNVQVSFEYKVNDQIDLLCSPNQLKQVFVNILKNAIESMTNGGTVSIDIKKLEDKKVLISFQDEGPGIDEELLEYLGTPFYTTKDKGIGLGLTVSNKIIQEHNGTMKIESNKGRGTTVKIELGYL